MKPWILSGAGNTFLIEISSQELPPSIEAVKALCHLYKTDGLLRLVPLRPLQFSWFFFNRDGSTAEFCGNAARCAQSYIYESGIQEKVLQISGALQFSTWTENSQHWVSLPAPKILDIDKKLKIRSGEYSGFWCQAGVPHFVIQDRNLSESEFRKISSELRAHPNLGESGANVTWVKNQRKNSVVAVTFERGVEDFTQACGSGAYAVSLRHQFENPEYNHFQIHMPGGTLDTSTKDGAWIMTGPVENIGEWSGSLV